MLPKACKVYHVPNAITEFSKGYSTILPSQFLQDDGGHGKTRKLHEHCLHCWTSFAIKLLFVQRNAVWNTMTVNKTFCKSKGGSFVRNIK